MPQVWLVNPIEKAAKPKRKPKASKAKTTSTPKRRSAKMAKKHRTAAQKRATAKLVAMNRARAKAAHRPKAKAKHRPAAKKAAHRPAARKTSVKRKTKHRITSARAASHAGRQLRYRRANPIGGAVGDFMNMLVPSAIGGGGALLTDVVMGVLPLPDAIKTGPFRPVVRIGAAVALGMAAGMVTSKQNAKLITSGALTVILYDTMKGMLSKVAGGKIPGLGLYEVPGIGFYEVQPAPAVPQIGYYDAGMQVGGVPMMADEQAEAVYG